MTVRLSEDEGKTWSTARQIDTRPAAYSDLTILADGTVGLLYETGDSSPYETLTFVRFHLDWLTRADVDNDGDGMSDYYEDINHLDKTKNDADADQDGDQASNRAEFEASTMASDAQSVFRLQSASLLPEGVRLVWTTVPGVFYTVQGAAEVSGEWKTEPGAANLLAIGSSLSYTANVAGASQRLLRVAIPTRR